MKPKGDAPEWVRKAAEGAEPPVDAASKLTEAREKLSKAQKQYDRWTALCNFAFWSVDAGSLNEAREAAEELLVLADKYKTDWNYGNALHKANLTLGRIELRQGNREKAKEHLLAAGRTPGSPQLDSFGPNMTLAKELLEAGDTDVVLQYFDLCQVFWKGDIGWLHVWRALINEGRKPNFALGLVT